MSRLTGQAHSWYLGSHLRSGVYFHLLIVSPIWTDISTGLRESKFVVSDLNIRAEEHKFKYSQASEKKCTTGFYDASCEGDTHHSGKASSSKASYCKFNYLSSDSSNTDHSHDAAKL